MRLFPRQFETIIGESDSDAVKITELAVTFEIKKTSSSKPVEGFVEIKNLSDATDSFIKNKGQRIRILGGYPGRTGLLFDGDIRSITRGRDNVDRLTRIELGGNVRKLTQARFTRAYAGALSIKQIVQDALPSFGLDFNSISLLPEVQKADFAFDGRTSDLLDKLLLPNGVSWRENDGVITFSKIGVADNLITVPVINPGSGLVGVPGQTEKGGIKFTSLLNPFLAIGKPVKVETVVLGLSGGGRDQNVRAGETQGIYKVISTNHRGDLRGTPFYTDVEGVAL